MPAREAHRTTGQNGSDESTICALVRSRLYSTRLVPNAAIQASNACRVSLPRISKLLTEEWGNDSGVRPKRTCSDCLVRVLEGRSSPGWAPPRPRSFLRLRLFPRAASSRHTGATSQLSWSAPCRRRDRPAGGRPGDPRPPCRVGTHPSWGARQPPPGRGRRARRRSRPPGRRLPG